MKVIKKDGTLEEYSEQNIINAINKSAQRENYMFTQNEYSTICNRVLNEIDEEEFDSDEVPVNFIHNIVEKTLLELLPKVGYQYQQLSLIHILYDNEEAVFKKRINDMYKDKLLSLIHILKSQTQACLRK